MTELQEHRVATLRPPLWHLHRGRSPILATAIHDGHEVDPFVSSCMALGADDRRREEDPYTGDMIAGVPNRITCCTSRFCVDLNRSLDKAVYQTPDDAWNLRVWRGALRDDQVAHLRLMHEDYYVCLEAVLSGLERRYARFVVLDIHSYNHRRDGPGKNPTAPQDAPDINIGTYTMDRARWAHVVDPFMAFCASHEIQGRQLDVRENVAFEGRGEQTRFIHERFPHTGCAIAVEFKKFFMDEWTGAPEQACVKDLQGMLTAAVPVLEQALGVRP